MNFYIQTWHMLMVSFMVAHLESSEQKLQNYGYSNKTEKREKRLRQLCSVSFLEIERNFIIIFGLSVLCILEQSEPHPDISKALSWNCGVIFQNYSPLSISFCSYQNNLRFMSSTNECFLIIIKRLDKKICGPT